MRLRDNIQSLSGKFYDVSITTGHGISSIGVYSNNASDFIKLNISNPGIDPSATQQMIYHSQGSIFGLLNTYPLSVPNPIEIYYSKRPKKTIDYTFIQLNPQDGVSGYPWGLGGFRICDNDSIYFFDSQRSQISIAKITGDQFDYRLGESLVRLNARTYNNETQIKFHDFPSRGAFNHTFGERPSSTVFYKIKNEETVAKSGSFVNKT
jgi:hypothetical protein